MSKSSCFSLSGFNCQHAVSLMTSELSPRPGLSGYPIVFPSSSHDTVNIIINSASVRSPFITTSFALTSLIMSSKPYVPTNPSSRYAG